MKELYDLINKLSLETNKEKRTELFFKIDLLKQQINLKIKTDAEQKNYSTYNG